MQFFLKKHAPGVATHLVRADLDVSGRSLTLNFTVSKRDNSEYWANPEFGEDYSKNWGLWETDVVEAFIQLRQTPDEVTAPYLEIQLSPLNQPFALVIRKPRVEFGYPENLDFSHSVDGEERTWRSKLQVTLPSELQGDLLFVGLHACLGMGEREYFALNPNPEDKPDFHRPELFVQMEK